MQWAAIVLVLAALGGATMAIIRLSGTPRPPLWMAIGHGLIAATGVILLAYAAATTGIPYLAQIALGLVILAALGGLTLFIGFDLQKKPLPIPLVLGHGLIALAGVICLLIAVYRP